MSLRRGMTNIFWMVVLAAIVVVGGAAAWFWSRRGSDSTADALIVRSQRGPFAHDVVERGEVESSSNIEIRCDVKSRNASGTAILEVVPEGTNVQEGDVLVKLDSSALELERTQQQIACNNSEAAMITSKNTYEAALIAQQEYLQGTFLQEEQVIQSEVFVAEENLRRAQLSMRSSERLAASGLVTPLQLEADRFATEKAEKELATAKTKLRVLQDFTKAKMLKQFDSDIKSAEAKWKADQRSYELEVAKLNDLNEQVRKCVIKAPAAGQVKYANIMSSSRGSSSAEFVVEPGALVRERQSIIRLPDPALMQVRAKINESRVSRVRPGQETTIFLDAYPDMRLTGEVVRVNEYPEPSSYMSTNVKEYATLIRVQDPPAGLRPGLTSMARIHIERLEDAVQVPVQSVLEHGGHVYCFVKTGDVWEPREVELGSNNDKFVVIRKGLEADEQVAANPRKLSERVPLPELPAGSQLAEKKPNNSTGVEAMPGSSAKPTEPGASATGGNPVIVKKDGPEAPGPGGGPPGGGPGGRGNGNAPPGQIAAGMMSRMDKDGDGKLSQEEIPEDRRDRYVGADQNNDGFIDLAELTANVGRNRGAGRPGGGPGGPSGPAGGPPREPNAIASPGAASPGAGQ